MGGVTTSDVLTEESIDSSNFNDKPFVASSDSVFFRIRCLFRDGEEVDADEATPDRSRR